jgi:hypothetical protein
VQAATIGISGLLGMKRLANRRGPRFIPFAKILGKTNLSW